MEYLDEVLHVRAQIKSNSLEEKLRKSIFAVLEESGISVSKELENRLIVAVADELGGIEGDVPILPTPNL